MKRIGQITKGLNVIPQGQQLSKSTTDLSKRSQSVLSRFKTAKDFAVEFNLDYCSSRYIAIKTNIDGIKSNTVKLRELSECYGDENIVNWIASWLVVLASKMDFSISPEQVGTTSILILEELYMINISEFSLFFKKLLKGHYGIFYGKFNMQTILIACKKYRSERGLIISKMTESEQKKIL